jgi:hypothetical protein
MNAAIGRTRAPRRRQASGEFKLEFRIPPVDGQGKENRRAVAIGEVG